MNAPRLPEELRFRVRLTTRWSDEDTQGVLNNAVYLTLLEESRHRYFSELGLLENNQFPFVLLQTNARFLAPLRGGEEVEVAVATTNLGNSSFQQAYRITSTSSDTVACEAEALLVGWDGDKRAKKDLGDAFREAVRELEGPAQ